jgi:S1-C subfamily serine protease
MLGYSEKANDFRPEDAPAFAQRIGLVSGSYSGNLTRGDLFASMAEALQFSYKGQDLTVLEKLIQTGTCSRYTANALGLLNRELTARQVADRHMSAVFCMDLYNNEAAVSDKTPTSNASGFFISADGLAVTNYHSIEGSLYATATLCTGDVYEIDRVIYYDKEIDIAVIRVSQTSVTNQTTSAFAYLDLAGTDDIRHGDIVYTLGNPLGLGLAVSSGIISDIARDVDRYQLPCVMSTASISQGSSGGALLNVYGQVIAVTSGAYTYGNNMYLAVPVDPVLTADLSANGQTLAAVSIIEAANAA